MRRSFGWRVVGVAGALAVALGAGCTTMPSQGTGIPVVPAVAGPPAYTVFFDLDSATITPDASAILDRVVRDYQQLRPVRLVLAGHADRSGSERHNRDLSGRRAEAVRRYLTTGGIMPDAVAVEALGEQQGLVRTPDGTVEPQNRRVEIFVRPD